MTLSALLLICSIAQAPDDCTEQTALQIVRAPAATSEIQCLRDGMAFAASIAIKPEPGVEFLKVVCRRKDRPDAVEP